MLSSHDFGDSEDRICTVISRPTGQRDDSSYLLVDIIPPLESAFWDEPKRNFEQLILSVISPGALNALGRADVLVDIVICPSYAGGAVDERMCSRIGTGSLHPVSKKIQSIGQPL